MKWKNKTRENGAHTPVYISWNSMMTRSKLASVVGGVCESWKNFDTFVEWYDSVEKQPGWHLDKDLLIKGNKTYSPDACVYLPQEINKAISGQEKYSRNDLPKGVTKHHNKYRAKCKDSEGGEWYESFTSIEEASAAYKAKKKEILGTLAEKYVDVLDKKAYSALLNYEF